MTVDELIEFLSGLNCGDKKIAVSVKSGDPYESFDCYLENDFIVSSVKESDGFRKSFKDCVVICIDAVYSIHEDQ